MPLLTRCTHCNSVFRITPEQLRAHGGQVRCGRCLQVFNGLAALVPDAPAAAAPPVPPPTGVEPGAEPPAAPPAPQSVPPPAAVADAAAAPATDDPGPLIDILPELPATVAAPAPDAAAEQPAVAALDDDNPFAQEAAAEDPAEPRRPLLAAAGVLLALALGTQAIFFYRGEIAARHPLARQWLSAACAQAGCTVALPQRPKSVLIEASDLQSVDPARPSRIQLTATLRNHAGHDVAYPALDLVLTNANDHTLARRIFLPDEYLGGGRDPRAGIAANAELTVRLVLETGNLGAAGFRLAVLAAPPG